MPATDRPDGQEPRRYVLDARVVTMDDALGVLPEGRVYVAGQRIAAVQPADAPAPEGFAGAPVVRTGGTIYPGLIELHNHLPYDVLPLWEVPRRYGNRGQWGSSNPDYRARVSGPMGVLGSVAGYIEAVVRYVEAKCLVAGVTTSQGVALYSNAGARRYFRGVVRNVEQPGVPDLPAASTRIADVEAEHAAAFRTRLEASSCLLLHLAEGVDDVARSHFRALRIDDRRWAISDALAGIHCAGLRGRDFATLRSRQGAMIWSPLSNLLLYGQTTDIRRAVQERVRMGLGSDWSPSGSKNLLGELKVAWVVAQQAEAALSARDLVAMATIDAARILKWQDALGSISPGKRADLVVVHGRQGDAHEHLLRARETGIVLTVIDGHARYGQPRLMRQLGADGETVAVGGSARVLDLVDATGDPVVGALPLAEAQDRLSDGMRRLPELAKRMDDGSLTGALLGLSSTSVPGSWFLELDHEPLHGFSSRPHLPFDGMPTGVQPEVLLAAPLADILVPMELDPLTVADDEGYFARLAASPNLPPYLLAELPPLYGERPRQPTARAAVPFAAAEGEATTPVRLADFLATVPSTLTVAERRLLVDQALVLLDDVYVHLELKRAMHAVEPIQRLRLLAHRLATPTGGGADGDDGDGLSDVALHRELATIFASVRDLHTNYLLPSPFRERTAFLPFLVERYHDGDEPRYLVTRVLDGVDHPTFVTGVEVTHFNGMRVERAVEVNAAVQGGGNPAASFARGLDALTIRPLVRSLPPDEEWVVVGYRGLDGVEREARWDWQVWAPPASLGVDPDGSDASSLATALGYDVQTDAVNQAKKVLFAPAAFALEPSDGVATARPVAVGGQDVATSMPTVFRVREVATRSGTFGYVRLFTFNVPDADAFVAEFARLADLLPPDGLIVDVRGNGGGLIPAAEQLLQVFTPRPIRPSRAQFLSTPLMLGLVQRHAPSPLDAGFDLGPWRRSLREAVTTGEVYSQGIPITDPAAANAVGQTYQGPVVLITDALCYSATDMFAAGFRDHDIGTILGVADNTGAGGANVWTHELLRRLLDVSAPDGVTVTPNPLRPLPRGAAMRVSVRRISCVGDREGTPLEDLGVRPDASHRMTRDDLLHGNRDLLERAGELLAAAPVHRLELVDTELVDGELRLTVRAVGVDRIDVWLDDRPAGSADVGGELATVAVRTREGTVGPIELRGFLAGEPAARVRRS
jgi:cytosine/adenosine deaminase-related metal-dependent hydrolase